MQWSAQILLHTRSALHTLQKALLGPLHAARQARLGTMRGPPCNLYLRASAASELFCGLLQGTVPGAQSAAGLIFEVYHRPMHPPSPMHCAPEHVGEMQTQKNSKATELAPGIQTGIDPVFMLHPSSSTGEQVRLLTGILTQPSWHPTPYPPVPFCICPCGIPPRGLLEVLPPPLPWNPPSPSHLRSKSGKKSGLHATGAA